MKKTTKKTGRAAETVALLYLALHGYKKVARNYGVKSGEIDLIVKNKKYLVFVEVKARKKNSLTSPAEAVNAAKQRRIVSAAEIFMQSCDEKLLDLQPRFDVISVEIGGLFYKVTEHIENAFEI